jgi:hypothetical protein
MTTNEIIQKGIGEIRDRVYRDQPDLMSALVDLIDLLDVATCEHTFVTKRRGGDPSDIYANETVAPPHRQAPVTSCTWTTPPPARPAPRLGRLADEGRRGRARSTTAASRLPSAATGRTAAPASRSTSPAPAPTNGSRTRPHCPKAVTSRSSRRGTRLTKPERDFVEPDARDTLGYVVRVERDADDVYAIVGLHGDDALKVAAKNGRSVGVAKRDARDAKGNEFPGEYLHHLALCPNSALPGLGGMARLAASADRPAIPVLHPGGCDPIGVPMNKETRRSFARRSRSRPTCPTTSSPTSPPIKALALSADVATVTTERDKFKGERDAEAQKVLALSAPTTRNPTRCPCPSSPGPSKPTAIACSKAAC